MNDVVRAVSEDEWSVLRSVRLQALADAPSAFGSTLAAEEQFTEERWRERAAGSSTSRLFLAWRGDEAVGIAGCIDEGDGSAQLVSVWVRPDHRARGVGRVLSNAALDFASDHGLTIIRLWVTEGNASARRLYERLGFTPTGKLQPLPSDPALWEHELELTVHADA